MNLENIGWNASFAEHLARLNHDQLAPARVIRVNRGSFELHSGRDVFSATLLGRFMYSTTDPAEFPTVGDWVAVQRFDDSGIIHTLLPRKGAFYRHAAGRVVEKQVLVANIDIVFIVVGLDNDYNLRRIERYLVQAERSNARPIVVLNKIDLDPDYDQRIVEVSSLAFDVSAIAVSATEGTNVDGLRGILRTGETGVVLGSSGAGKSTLVNVLAGDQRLRTGSVREDDSRGRHTTSYRELIVLPDGGMIIDTPGLRELQLWSDESDVDQAFPEIMTLAGECRFRDCSHISEPDCAVLTALVSGDLDRSRYESYCKLRRETRYLESRLDESKALQEKKRDKKFGKLLKEIKRHNPKR